MAAPALNSISPSFGPPGTVITLLGAGFDAGAQVACPSFVATTFVSATELRATIPLDVVAPQPGSTVVSVYVANEDTSISGILPFTVNVGYPQTDRQAFTTLDAVAAEVPGFKRGGRITDDTLQTWLRSVAQGIAGSLLRRGLSLNPADWQKPDPSTALPTAAGVLETINRLGSAARLASAISSDFGQTEWGLAKNLQREYERELKRLDDGSYDKLFRPAAATVETGRQVAGGDVFTSTGDADQAFTKDQVF
jgi:hypothetical protein